MKLYSKENAMSLLGRFRFFSILVSFLFLGLQTISAQSFQLKDDGYSMPVVLMSWFLAISILKVIRVVSASL